MSPVSAHVPLVVIADDEPEDIVHLERALAATGLRHKVVAVSSGESAMNYLQRWLAVSSGEIVHALLLLDWRMPAADGLAVLRWVRAQPRLQSLQVVIVSHSDRPEDLAAAQAAGANASLRKDAPLREMTRVLGDALVACTRAVRPVV